MASRILTDGPLRAMRGVALAALLGGGLGACATVQSRAPLADLRDTPQGAPMGSGEHLRGTEKPYQVNGIWYYPKADPGYDQVGMASWYGYPFQARKTADGEVFDQTLISAAHKTLPLPCVVEVTNLQNGRTLKVRVNDRGPFVDGRLIDLSKAAAEQLGFDRQGLTKVRVRYISAAGPAAPLAPGLMDASYRAPPKRMTQAGVATDGFDDIEQSDAAGRIRPAPPAVSRVPTDTDGEFAAPPPASTEISSRPLPTLANDIPPAPAAPAYTPIASGAFAVQAGAFASRPAADRAAARLASAGVPSISPIERNGGTLYRVTVGAFPDPGSAAEARARVIASGFADAKVVQAF